MHWASLPLLARAFAGVRFHRFESAQDCWSDEVRVATPGRYGGMRAARANVAATRYGVIVDTTRDKELFMEMLSGDGDAIIPAGVGARLDADVLVHAVANTLESVIVNGLSRRGWAGREGDAGCWTMAGTPREAANEPAPTVAIVPQSAYDVASSCGALQPWRLPADARAQKDGRSAQINDRIIERTAAVIAALAPTCWTRAPPAVSQLRRFTAGDVECDLAATAAGAGGEDEGARAAAANALLAPFPVAPRDLLDWLLKARELAAGRIALVDATPGGNEVAVLSALPKALRHYCESNSASELAALGAATARAHTVVFYCNRASTRSPARAVAFAAWARGALPAGRRPKVRVVAGGADALVAAGLREVNEAARAAAGS